jgi:hypothetical protein
LSNLIDPDPADHTRLTTPASLEVAGHLRELPPGLHDVGLRVEGLDTDATNPVRIRTLVEGIELSCDATDLLMPQNPARVTTCRVKPLPDSLTQFPVDTEVAVGSSNDAIVRIPRQPRDPLEPFAVNSDRDIGSATLTANAEASSVPLGTSETELTVRDERPPLITIGDDLGHGPFPPNQCGSARLRPGDSFQFGATATDNHSMLRVRIRAPVEFVTPADRDFICPVEGDGLGRSCTPVFIYAIRDDAPAGDIVFRVQATDISLNTADSTCRYFVDSDATPVATSTPVQTHTSTPTRTPTRTPTHTPPQTPGMFTIEYRKLEDSPRVLPGGDGFERYTEYAVDDGRIVYSVRSTVDAGREGIVLVSDDDRTLIVSRSSEVPGTQGQTFTTFNDLSVDGDLVAFRSVTSGVVYGQTLSHAPGPVMELVRMQQPPFSGLGQAVYDGGRVGIRLGSVSANDPRFVGVVTGGVASPGGENLFIVADTNSPIPGGDGNFAVVGHDRIGGMAFEAGPQFRSDNLAFIGAGEDGRRGVYFSLSGAPPEVVADDNTLIREGTGTFEDYCGLALDGENLVFRGSRDNQQQVGIYVATDGQIRRVADRTMIALGGAQFSGFPCENAIDSGVIAFRGLIPGTTVLLVEIGRQLITVAKSGDVLDGKTVDNVVFNDDDSLDGSPPDGLAQLAFEVFFEDGTGALYVATIRQ